MKKLYTYVLKSFLRTFILTFFICVFILLLQFLWVYIDELVGKGLEPIVMAKILFHTSITFVPMALPLAILMASLMTFGNLGEYYELVAMKSAGISTWRIMQPLVILCVVLSITAFVFSNNLLPVATLKSKSLLYDIRKKKLAFDIKKGIYYRDIDNYVIRIDDKSADGNSIYNIKIYDHTSRNGNTKITVADSGNMSLSKSSKKVIFTLYNGYNYEELVDADDYKDKVQFERMCFDKQLLKFDLAEFDLTRTKEELFKSHHSMLNVKQLSHAVDSLTERYDYKNSIYRENFVRRYQNFSTIQHRVVTPRHNDLKVLTEVQQHNDSLILKWPLLSSFSNKEARSVATQAVTLSENTYDNIAFNKRDNESQNANLRNYEQVWHKKFTLSIACLLFFFIGAPLGAIIRKGGLGLPTIVSILFFVAYYVLSISLERVALAGDMNMFLGVWTSSLALLPIGIFLTYKATTDAPLFDAESWSKIFEKCMNYFVRRKKTKYEDITPMQ